MWCAPSARRDSPTLQDAERTRARHRDHVEIDQCPTGDLAGRQTLPSPGRGGTRRATYCRSSAAKVILNPSGVAASAARRAWVVIPSSRSRRDRSRDEPADASRDRTSTGLVLRDSGGRASTRRTWLVFLGLRPVGADDTAGGGALRRAVAARTRGNPCCLTAPRRHDRLPPQCCLHCPPSALLRRRIRRPGCRHTGRTTRCYPAAPDRMCRRLPSGAPSR